MKLKPFMIAFIFTALAPTLANAQEKQKVVVTESQLNELPVFLKAGYEKKMFTIKGVEELSDVGMTMFAIHSKESGDGVLFAANGYMFVGNIINNQGVSISEQYAKKYETPISHKEDIKTLESANLVTWGTGAETAYLVLDPKCPHCITGTLEALERNPKLADKYTLKLLMVGFVAQNSKQISELIIERTNAGENFVSVWRGLLSSNISATTATPKVDKNSGVMRQIGVNSTPYIIVKDGDDWVPSRDLLEK